MRFLLLILGLVLVLPEAYALRGGPFDSSSNQSGVDHRRGTFRTVVRGRNLIGYCTFSSSSNLDSYGSSRFWIDGISCLGDAQGLIEDDVNLVFFDANGVSPSGTVRAVGQMNLKVKNNGYPYRASGKGRVEVFYAQSNTLALLENLRDLGVNIRDFLPDPADGATLADVIAQFSASLVPETESRRLTIYGETRQTSLNPSLIFFRIVDANGNVNGPVAADPTNAQQFIEIINQLRGIRAPDDE